MVIYVAGGPPKHSGTHGMEVVVVSIGGKPWDSFNCSGFQPDPVRSFWSGLSSYGGEPYVRIDRFGVMSVVASTVRSDDIVHLVSLIILVPPLVSTRVSGYASFAAENLYQVDVSAIYHSGGYDRNLPYVSSGIGLSSCCGEPL